MEPRADGPVSGHEEVLLLPEGTDPEDSLPLDRITGLQANGEEVWPTHSLVHSEFGGKFRLLSGCQGRRTDDRLGGSAPLYRLHWRVRRQA